MNVAMQVRPGWPFVGRQVELAALLGTVTDATGSGAVLVGAPGVGRSRLAGEVVTRVRRLGRAVTCCYGTAAAAKVRFGAFAPVLPDDMGVTVAGNPLRRAVEILCSRAGGQRLVLVVDDAHLLDDASMALLDQATRHRMCSVLLTARSRAIPPSLVDLYKDGVLVRIEVTDLHREDMAELLSTVLGGPADAGTVARLWALSAGNPLYLRELVVAGLDVGSLTARGGVWSWRGPVPMSGGLADAVQAGIGRLGEPARHTLELVAYGGSLGLDVLTTLAAPAVVDDLEAQGLVNIEHVGRRTNVRLAHPLHGELLRMTCPTNRSRAHWRRLADAVQATGARRREDLLRLADWRLNSCSSVPVKLLAAGTGQAWSARQVDLAERLGRAAMAAGGGPRVGAILGTALLLRGAPDEAEALLATTMTGTIDPVAAARLGCARAFNLFLGLARADDAAAVLDQVTRPGIPRHVADAAYGMRLAIAALHQHTDAVLAGWAAVASRDRPVPTTVGGGVAHAVALLFAGRYSAAVATLDRAATGPPGWRRAVPWLAEASAWVRCWSLMLAGALTEADEIAARMRVEVHDGPNGDIFSTVWCGVHSYRARMRGRAGEALRWAQEAVNSLRRRPTPFDAPAWAELACASAAAGRIAEATEALRRADAAVRPAWRMTGFWVDLARPWVSAAAGRDREAMAAALAVADDARGCGAHGYEAIALHDAVRLGAAATPGPGPRLAELADLLGDPLTRAFATHAAARHAADPTAVEAAAGHFAELGMDVVAAEALTAAARLHHQGGRAPAGQAVSRRLALLTTRFDGAPTPALAANHGDGLTPRQFEVARLAGIGMTNQAIADRLGTSKRTIDNHLYAVYSALGVAGRAGLAELLTTYAAAGGR